MNSFAITNTTFSKEKNALYIELADADLKNPIAKGCTSSLPKVIRFKQPAINSKFLNEVKSQKSDLLLYEISTDIFSIHAICNQYYEIPIAKAPIFYRAIKRMQSENPKFIVPKQVFDQFLLELENKKYITVAEKKQLISEIITGSTLEEFKTVTTLNKEPLGALSLAAYYRDLSRPDDCMNWVYLADRWLKESNREFSDVIDIDNFFSQGFGPLVPNSIFFTGDMYFCDLLAKSPLFTELHFNEMVFKYSVDLSINFLKSSQFIQKLTFSFYNLSYRSLPSQPFIEAIKSNKTIRSLKFSHSGLYPDFTVEILEAIKNNPDLKITDLFFSAYDTLENGVGEKLLQLLSNKSNSIRSLSIKHFDCFNEKYKVSLMLSIIDIIRNNPRSAMEKLEFHKLTLDKEAIEKVSPQKLMAEIFS